MRAWVGALAWVLASCGGDVTEIVLVVDTNLPAASFRVEASYPSGGMGVSTADLSEQPAPRRLVLVHEAAPLGPVQLRFAALDAAGVTLASTRRDVTFEAGRSLTLVVRIDSLCATASCTGDGTCGNDGRCRAVGVAACEYEGRGCDADAGPEPGLDAGRIDAGTRDAGPEPGEDAGTQDSGTCPGLCGVPERALPGDRVVPAPCAAGPSYRVEVRDPGGGSILGDGAPLGFTLAEPGPHTVVLQQDGCVEVAATLDVAGATGPPMPLAGSNPLRDLAARVGTGFVVGGDGAFAADQVRWHDLRSPAVALGDAVDMNLSSVAVVDDRAYVGPVEDRDAVWRVEVSLGVTTASAARLGIGGGSRRVYALASRASATGPLGVACGRVTVVDDPGGGATPGDLEPGYEPQVWIALGTRQYATLGAVWAGRSDELVNRALSSTEGSFGMGAVIDMPTDLGAVAAAAIADAEGIGLWLCGDASLQRFSFADQDWSSATSLPAAAVRVPLPCLDVALGDDGDVWVAGGAAGLLRFAPDGTQRAAITAPRHLPAGASIDRVAFAFDATIHEVWALDVAARRVYRFSTAP